MPTTHTRLSTTTHANNVSVIKVVGLLKFCN